MATPSLRTAIERVFSDDFLFHRDNRAWHAVVVDDEGEPQDVDAFQLATFSDVASNASLVPAVMVKEIAAAVEGSAVVAATVEGESVTLKRKAALKPDEDPDLRTLFVKPVHYDATDDQITAFFSKWGTVEAVERRQYLAGAAGSEKVRPSTFVTFKTREQAMACVAAKPSYGACESDLGGLFVPQLQVMTKDAHERAQSAVVQRGAALQVQQAMTGGAAAAVPAADPLGAHKSLRPKCTCKVPGLSADATWQPIKAKLGNLVVSHPELKKKIGLVHVEDGAAYVVCKTPEAAQTLLVAYGSVSKQNEKFAEDLRAVVPRLVLCEGDDEAAFIQKYPSLVTGQVAKKVVANQKRGRD